MTTKHTKLCTNCVINDQNFVKSQCLSGIYTLQKHLQWHFIQRIDIVLHAAEKTNNCIFYEQKQLQMMMLNLVIQ